MTQPRGQKVITRVKVEHHTRVEELSHHTRPTWRAAAHGDDMRRLGQEPVDHLSLYLSKIGLTVGVKEPRDRRTLTALNQCVSV